MLFLRLCLHFLYFVIEYNGLLSTLEQARTDDDNDLNFQIDTFSEDQKHDDEEFLGHFDQNDNQAVCQAIQLQVCH